ncbi:Cap15 family cyclic dinucleotide receptor domain-containing protein [Thiomicrospira microaerophila]|uniref:Cap15 family cyclic dinucleotide receptor domain-containing protein n=1 Tax=Thiomicrospira microaerophila TaxID=406020 RepID=UPI0005CA23E1|nr:hypothetical protein [Thiomicrospira microaerophila]
MNNVTLKSSVYLLVFISAIAWTVLTYLGNSDISDYKDFFGLIPKVVSIDLLVIFIFVKWGWKLKIFRGWLVPFPNLNGSWVGHIYSDWRNPKTGLATPPIPVLLTIKQSFFQISCVMHTEEMNSYSYTEGFLINTDRQEKNLAYSYSSKPRLNLSNRSSPHDGTAVFKIIETPEKKLVGRYWTERETKGEIIFEYRTKDLLEELPSDLSDHPVTEIKNRR